MASLKMTRRAELRSLAKALTGIEGLDAITEGGLPRGRPTLVCGGAGSGKTLLAVEFLVRGATQYREPGVLMTFEETGAELEQNVASLGFDLAALTRRRKLVVDHVQVDRANTRETGDFSLEGIFVRLGHAIDRVGARRVAFDSLETLFGGFDNSATLRAELGRLFRWLKAREVTAIVTAESSQGGLTRHGIEEFVSDCVIVLSHRSETATTTRRLRVVKYRGSRHGTEEYPFLISTTGLSVLPISSLGLNHVASTRRIPTGVPRLDTMLGGAGYFRGSSILVSGTAGTGKTSLAAHLLDATCRRGERCLAVCFEESPSQIVRNMRSIGIDLQPWIRRGLLTIHASRPTLYGLEAHLLQIHQLIEATDPSTVVVDPVTNLSTVANVAESRGMLTRLIDYLKLRGVTALFTALVQSSGGDSETTSLGISSLMDTWLLVRDSEINGERNRVLYVLKSRGMAHSNQVREFRLTAHGIELLDVYSGGGGVLTGTARIAQEARERVEAVQRVEAAERIAGELERKVLALRAQSVALEAEIAFTLSEQQKFDRQVAARHRAEASDRAAMKLARHADREPVLHGPPRVPSRKGA